MKVLFLNLAAEWGGGEGWTLRTASSLSGRGHDVHLAAREGSALLQRGTRAGLPVHPLEVGIDYHPGTVLRLARLMRRLGTEVLVMHHNKDVRTGGVAAKLIGVPAVHRNGYPILHDNLRHRITARFIDRILTNSRRIRDRYLGYGWLARVPMDIVPNGVVVPDDPATDRSVWRHFGLDSSDLIALFAGRLTAVKRVGDLLTALSGLPEDSRWRLVVAGTGTEAEPLAARIRDEGLAGRVILAGFREDAAELTGAADLVVLPSRDEGMPNTLMEAMARETAVAATPVGDVPHLLGDGDAGWMVPVGDVSGWTRLLAELERDPGKLAEMGRKGRARIRDRFTHERMIDGVEACLRRAVENRG